MMDSVLTVSWGFGYWSTIVIVTGVALAMGYVLYEGLLASLRGESFERSILLTLGLSMILQNGAVFLFTTTPKMIETPLSYSNIVVGDLRLPVPRLFALRLRLASSAPPSPTS